ncbi:MAG: protein kinase domain-containing protein [Gemmatimonadales bacterium]
MGSTAGQAPWEATLDRLRAALADRYRLGGELGRGGMAVVFLAQDLKHSRPVAIKVIRPEVSSVVGAERFHREVRIAARLQHPGIVAVHDSGEAGAARRKRRYGSADFGTAPGTLPASLLNIIEEKYLTLFLNPEVWNDWKRTCLPSLAPALGAAAIPGRLAYSDDGPNTPTTSSAGVAITPVSRNPNQPAACPALNYTTSNPLAN